MPEDDKLEWIIDLRSSNQKVLLRLYRFAENKSKVLPCDKIGRSVFQFLVGAGFSLWRGAFLIDAKRKPPEINEAGTELLKRLVRHNAVGYTQDRQMKDWMSGYYLNNAQWRLLYAWEELNKDNEDQMPDTLCRLQDLNYSGTEEELPMELWEASHAAFLELLHLLEKRFDRKT